MKDVKKICAPTTISVAPSRARRASLRLPNPPPAHSPTMTAKSARPDDADDGSEYEPVLEPKPSTQPLEELILVADEVDAVGARAQTEADRLHPQDDQQAADDQRMVVQPASEDRHLREDEQR